MWYIMTPKQRTILTHLRCIEQEEKIIEATECLSNMYTMIPLSEIKWLEEVKKRAIIQHEILNTWTFSMKRKGK